MKVRRAHFQDGLSGRQIARDFGISRDSVSKMLSYFEPPGYRRTAAIKRPKLDPYVDQIDHWLVEDKDRPRKQRHTAKRIFERLGDECGFNGGYTIVKDYVRSKKRGSREMFVPLSHPPGHVLPDRRMQSMLPRGRRPILAKRWLSSAALNRKPISLRWIFRTAP